MHGYNFKKCVKSNDNKYIADFTYDNKLILIDTEKNIKLINKNYII